MTSLSFNPFNLRKNCRDLQNQENAIKRKISGFNGGKNSYGDRLINSWMAFAFIAMLPFCCFQMLVRAIHKGFFLNIVKNDLSNKIFSSYHKMYWLDRFAGETSKLFIQPMRIFSHTSRGEWSYSNELLASLVKYSCFCYITIFFLIFRRKKFFIREDFFAASSCLASMRELWGGPDLISFQHGSMNLERIQKYRVYPGQRARLQIANDKHTYNIFRKLALDKISIFGPVPNYYPIKFNATECKEILFIGNGDIVVRNQIFEMMKSISNPALDNGFKIFYKPHPSEVFDLHPDDGISLMGNFNEDRVLGDNRSKILIGVTSTVLYDAIIMGQKVLFIRNKDSEVLDSIRLLGQLNYIDDDEKAWEYILDSLNKVEVFDDNYENIDEFVFRIKKNIDFIR